jgi:hypothetical protein
MADQGFGPFDMVAMLGLCFAAVRIFVGPIGQAIADRVRGRHEAPSGTDPALVGEVDQLQARLADVEERLDFAERLLARASHPDQIPGGMNR